MVVDGTDWIFGNNVVDNADTKTNGSIAGKSRNGAKRPASNNSTTKDTPKPSNAEPVTTSADSRPTSNGEAENSPDPQAEQPPHLNRAASPQQAQPATPPRSFDITGPWKLADDTPPAQTTVQQTPPAPTATQHPASPPANPWMLPDDSPVADLAPEETPAATATDDTSDMTGVEQEMDPAPLPPELPAPVEPEQNSEPQAVPVNDPWEGFYDNSEGWGSPDPNSVDDDDPEMGGGWSFNDDGDTTPVDANDTSSATNVHGNEPTSQLDDPWQSTDSGAQDHTNAQANSATSTSGNEPEYPDIWGTDNEEPHEPAVPISVEQPGTLGEEPQQPDDNIDGDPWAFEQNPQQTNGTTSQAGNTATGQQAQSPQPDNIWDDAATTIVPQQTNETTSTQTQETVWLPAQRQPYGETSNNQDTSSAPQPAPETYPPTSNPFDIGNDTDDTDDEDESNGGEEHSKHRVLLIVTAIIVGLLVATLVIFGARNLITRINDARQQPVATQSADDRLTTLQGQWADKQKAAQQLIDTITASPVADDDSLKQSTDQLAQQMARTPMSVDDLNEAIPQLQATITRVQDAYKTTLANKVKTVQDKLTTLASKSDSLGDAPNSDDKTAMQKLASEWGSKKVTTDNLKDAISAQDQLETLIKKVEKAKTDKEAEDKKEAEKEAAARAQAEAEAQAQAEQQAQQEQEQQYSEPQYTTPQYSTPQYTQTPQYSQPSPSTTQQTTPQWVPDTGSGNTSSDM